jgi:hypothetical protein
VQRQGQEQLRSTFPHSVTAFPFTIDCRHPNHSNGAQNLYSN